MYVSMQGFGLKLLTLAHNFSYIVNAALLISVHISEGRGTISEC